MTPSQELFHSLLIPLPKQSRSIDFSFLHPVRPTIVFESYWKFAAERQKIYLKRLRNLPPPWTIDPILETYRFTNTYRAADRVSQFLIEKIIYGNPHSEINTIFRILLFKLFNRIETWELLEKEHGEICIENFSVKDFNKTLNQAISTGQKIYSAAYIMPTGTGEYRKCRKHFWHLNLLQNFIESRLLERLGNSKSLSHLFDILHSCPGIGEFLAYQFAIDINYSSAVDFSEMDFVMPGPGAKSGLRKCFSDYGGLTDAELIRLITENQDRCFAAMEIDFPTLWGRRLQLIDCQNLLCEVDKYSRVAHPEFSKFSGRFRIKQTLKPKHSIPVPFFPPKWHIFPNVTPN